MKIVGFGHKKRVGKDTAVGYALSFARQYYPHLKCDRLSFGDQLKKVSCQMFSWAGLMDSVYYINHPEEREVILPIIGMSPRQIWDEIGSFGARLCPKVWPELALIGTDSDILFCPDVRRPIEIEYIRKFHGLVFRVDRKAAPISNHIVDTALDGFDEWDGILTNNEGRKEFNLKIKKLVVGILNEGQMQGLLICPGCFAKGKAIMTGAGFVCEHCKHHIKG